MDCDEEDTTRRTENLLWHTRKGLKMTDKELLELALKASLNGEEIAGFTINEILSNSLVFDDIIKQWNPLTDDGDALRLAVKLGLGISIPLSNKRTDVVTFSGPITSVIEAHGDPYAATRRAITRAAAEIGKAMES